MYNSYKRFKLFNKYPKEFFNRNGFCITNQVFNKKEIKHLQEISLSYFGLENSSLSSCRKKGKVYQKSGAPTKDPSFSFLLNFNKLVDIISQIAAEKVEFFPHNDLHIDQGGGIFHRDSAERIFGIGDSWKDPEYKIYRVAIYLSSFSKSGSRLHIFPGSHLAESKALHFFIEIFNKLIRILRVNRFLKFIKIPHEIFKIFGLHTIFTSPGTVVIFDPRIIHAGGHLFGEYPKLAIYLSYAVKNDSSKKYLNWLMQHKDY